MSLIQSRYLQLAPNGENLRDIVVLAQAWKKSHQYIRRHNWYADVLALDASVINLESQLRKWGDAIKQGNFQPEPLRLVPAPKNARWVFRTVADSKGPLDTPSFDDWAPESVQISELSETTDDSCRAKDTAGISLRPLAHLSIRDQTLATAILMCLAEAVETTQGNTTADLSAMRAKGVCSYGNRLHCTWEEIPENGDRARFSWGNSKTYRLYFQDYRAFLARPRRVCAEIATGMNAKRNLFVVSLDIKSFFDCIGRNALIDELQTIEQNYRQKCGLTQEMAADGLFWERVKRILNWQWAEEDQDIAWSADDDAGRLPNGLPQGLVASGFLANAYMIGFDRSMTEMQGQNFDSNIHLKIHDYCRYVDDLRLVVETDVNATASAVLDEVMRHVQQALDQHRVNLGATQKLELSTNSNKCTATPYHSIASRSHLSSQMEMLNAELSGPADLESLTQTAGGLDALLLLSDQIDTESEPKQTRLALGRIATPNPDVRDDTVKRFVASRLTRTLRDRLGMTDLRAPVAQDDRLDDPLTNGVVMANEFEATARKLIKCWAENPALTVLLKCGLDLYPHPKLLSPVIEAIEVKLFTKPANDDSNQREREILVAQYVAAELLKTGATETGFRPAEEYPESVDITGYREILVAFARRIVFSPNFPWFLLQQAYLYLIAMGNFGLTFPRAPKSTRAPKATQKAKLTTMLEPYRDLLVACVYAPASDEKLLDLLPLSLVAQQIHPNTRRFANWLVEGLNQTTTPGVKEAVIDIVALTRPDLLVESLKANRQTNTPVWHQWVPDHLHEARRQRKQRKTRAKPTIQNGKMRSLFRWISDSPDTFNQENGILMLAATLLEYGDIEQLLADGLNPTEIQIQCKDWSQIHHLPEEPDFLCLGTPTPSKKESGPLYATPPWIEPDKAWLYGLGRILRSAVTGEFDFTSRHFLVSEDVGKYTGLNSTWYRRRFGLLNSGASLLDEPSPLSPWLSGFLSALLQWPGVDFKNHDVVDTDSISTAKELLLVVKQRIAEQRALFGTRSKTPIYVIPTDDDAPVQKRALRVAIVQPMRPTRREFDNKDPVHWTPGVLAEHKSHLAEVCRLTLQKVKAWASAKPSSDFGTTDDFTDTLDNRSWDTLSHIHSYAEPTTPSVDVILFPELAVHPAHVPILRQLSDKLKANIFAGLTFMQSDKVRAPINQGLWLIRSESPSHGRTTQYIWQGKHHLTKDEINMNVESYRPHLTLVELPIGFNGKTRIAAAICYDATDLDLLTDLRDRSDVFLVAALNQDVQTFDNMVAALHFHMYQPVILANSGEFGGSTAQIPLPKHDRLIAHVHGNQQVAVSVFEVNPSRFKTTVISPPETPAKTPPAGYKGRGH